MTFIITYFSLIESDFWQYWVYIHYELNGEEDLWIFIQVNEWFVDKPGNFRWRIFGWVPKEKYPVNCHKKTLLELLKGKYETFSGPSMNGEIFTINSFELNLDEIWTKLERNLNEILTKF